MFEKINEIPNRKWINKQNGNIKEKNGNIVCVWWHKRVDR